MICTQVIFPF
uniref:Uncharacterized protein n=1 Tax=Anguilla anguilla TaxID=7936 RepID=A0A0E9PEW3_ANGAN